MNSLLIPYILKGVFRNRFISILLSLFATCGGLAVFFGVSAVTEQDQFSVVFLSSFIRLAGIFTLILFVTSFVKRSFDRHEVEFLLTRPISRFHFILSYNFSFYILAFLVFILSILTLSPFIILKTISIPGFSLWSVGLFLEYITMCTVVLFFAVLLRTTVASILSSTGFYILARIMGDLMGVIESQKNAGYLNSILENIVIFISIFIPRFDLTLQSSWLLYGINEISMNSFPAMQLIIFCALIFMATLLDFNRKEF